MISYTSFKIHLTKWILDAIFLCFGQIIVVIHNFNQNFAKNVETMLIVIHSYLNMINMYVSVNILNYVSFVYVLYVYHPLFFFDTKSHHEHLLLLFHHTIDYTDQVHILLSLIHWHSHIF